MAKLYNYYAGSNIPGERPEKDAPHIFPRVLQEGVGIAVDIHSFLTNLFDEVELTPPVGDRLVNINDAHRNGYYSLAALPQGWVALTTADPEDNYRWYSPFYVHYVREGECMFTIIHPEFVLVPGDQLYEETPTADE